MANVFEGLDSAVASAEVVMHIDTVMLPQPICVQLGAQGTTLDNVVEWPRKKTK